ncbi:MAG: hypothetical protein WBE76_06255 [Terracidiphilus sp.]
MKRVFAISVALLASTAMLAAQAVDQYRSQKFDSRALQSQSKLVLDWSNVHANSGCPVSFSAKQGWDGGLVATRKAEPSEPGFSQRIFLSLADKESSSVAGARVTVHGLTPKSRVLPVELGADGPAQISRSLNVSFTRDAMGETGAGLVLRGYSAVYSIDVDSITYADGTTWKSGEGLCRVVPDPMMLVSAR